MLIKHLNKLYFGEISAALGKSDRNRSLTQEEFNKMDFIGTVSSGVLLGFGAVKKWHSQIYEIRALFVYPHYRKEGIGTKLIDWISTENHNKTILGFTNPINEGCARAFSKNGYTKLNLKTMLMFVGRRDGIRGEILSETIIQKGNYLHKQNKSPF